MRRFGKNENVLLFLSGKFHLISRFEILLIMARTAKFEQVCE